jgi:hypothetical protein
MQDTNKREETQMRAIQRPHVRTGRFGLCAVAVLGGCLLALPAARAEGNGYEECKQILVAGVFNKFSARSSGSSTMSAATKEEAFFSSESDAFQQYKKDHSEAQANGLKIDAEAHYGIAGGEFELAMNAKKEMSQSEFSSMFKKAKQERRSSKSSAQGSTQQFSNDVLNEIRDPDTTQAWKECVSRTRETNVYAFANRDGAGKIYVNVIWVPGAFAGTAPTIPITFVSDGDKKGIKVHAKATESIAMGTGTSFAVSCGTECSKGFRVTVNAALRNAKGVAVTSFTNAVDVPPAVAPVPECGWEGDWRSEWTAGGDSKYAGLVTFSKSGGSVSGKYDYGTLTLRGTGATLAGEWRHPPNSHFGGICDHGTVTFTKSGCSFEGAWNYCADAPKHYWNGKKLQ